MLVREIFNAFEDSFQFTKTHWWREERPQPGAFSTLPTGTPTSPQLPQPPPQHRCLGPLLWKTQLWICPRRQLAVSTETQVSFRHKCLEERKTTVALPYSTVVSNENDQGSNQDWCVHMVFDLQPAISCIYVNFLCLRMWMVILTLWRWNKSILKGSEHRVYSVNIWFSFPLWYNCPQLREELTTRGQKTPQGRPHKITCLNGRIY